MTELELPSPPRKPLFACGTQAREERKLLAVGLPRERDMSLPERLVTGHRDAQELAVEPVTWAGPELASTQGRALPSTTQDGRRRPARRDGLLGSCLQSASGLSIKVKEPQKLSLLGNDPRTVLNRGLHI